MRSNRYQKLTLPVFFFLAVSVPSNHVAHSQQNARDTEHTEAAAFDRIACTLFKNVYPLLARQIKENYGIVEGKCLDVGAGPGYLSIELAKITQLNILAFDIDPEALKIADKNILQAGLSGRVQTVRGDVHKMDIPSGSIDLIVSRGSYIFWTDKAQAFREIARVLKPGGVAFVGGGLGNLLPHDERTLIQETMEKENIGPPADLKVSLEEMGTVLRKAGINQFEITTDEGCLCGLWVEFKKPSAAPLN